MGYKHNSQFLALIFIDCPAFQCFLLTGLSQPFGAFPLPLRRYTRNNAFRLSFSAQLLHHALHGLIPASVWCWLQNQDLSHFGPGPQAYLVPTSRNLWELGA